MLEGGHKPELVFDMLEHELEWENFTFTVNFIILKGLLKHTYLDVFTLLYGKMHCFSVDVADFWFEHERSERYCESALTHFVVVYCQKGLGLLRVLLFMFYSGLSR